MQPTADQVVALVCKHLKASPDSPSVRRVPTGKFNDTFDVGLGERHVIVRIAPPDETVFCFYERRMMRQEPAIHAMLLERTDVPVPRILAADFTREMIDRDFLIMDKVPGRPLTEARVTASQQASILRATGRYLRQAHDLTAETYGYIGEHHPMEPAATWPAAFEVMWNRLIDDVVAVDGYTPAEARFMRDLYADRADHFTHETPSRFLHMDIWHQNILVDGRGAITALVDWDRALWGDPEIEFAVLDYCGISAPPFWEGYGRDRPTGRGAEVRRVLYLLYEMQKYIVIRKGRSGRPAEALAHKERCLALARRLAAMG